MFAKIIKKRRGLFHWEGHQHRNRAREITPVMVRQIYRYLVKNDYTDDRNRHAGITSIFLESSCICRSAVNTRFLRRWPELTGLPELIDLISA